MAKTENPLPESPAFKLPDPATLTRSMADVAERSQRIVGEWLKRQADGEAGGANGSADAMNIGRAFMEMTAKLMADPAQLLRAQIGF